jgi:2,3-bisphosphoglycerate-independent phosphoglycerate mutase
MPNENKRPLALVVLDGWGYREEKEHNAVAAAKTPNFDRIWASCPKTLLKAGEEAVGLPVGQVGNSEVGHTTIGAGAILDTDLVRIGKAAEAQFEGNASFAAAFGAVKAKGTRLHALALIGPGGVHAHESHLFAFLRAAKAAGVTDVAIHAFTDGRDAPPKDAAKHLSALEKELGEVGVGAIATVTGRYYAMDRDKNWDRVEKAEAALFKCEGNVCKIGAANHLASLYDEEILDEHVEPFVLMDAPIKKGDAVVFLNFRSDRARQLTERIFARKDELDLTIVTMTEYASGYPVLVAFPPKVVETTLAAQISAAGMTQAHVAETEKFPHATYFLNGGRELPHEGEEHVLLASRKDVKTHDEAPEMRAADIALETAKRFDAGVDFAFVNIANADMVGHTAKPEAIVKSVEAADAALGVILDAVARNGGVTLVTADHGNAEVNIDGNGAPHTAHTLSPVPFIVVGAGDLKLRSGGGLADIAPTALELLGIPKPAAMTGDSLVH